MVRSAPPEAGKLESWRARAGTLPPVLADALEACAGRLVHRPECGDTLDLLGMLGCDARLYDGSWEDWSAHKELPAEVTEHK